MDIKERSEEIHTKGFDLFNYQGPLDYRKIKVGVKNLDDAILNLGTYNSKNLPKYNGISKSMIL